MAEYTVNLCMATFNRLEFTKKSISSILSTASDKVPYMLSIIDNGSTDGSREYLSELFEQKLIHNLILLDKNIGVSKAHNILWKKFEDVPYYAKIDNDVTFNKKNWLDDIIHVYENVPNMGVVGYNVEAKNYYPIVQENGVKYRRKYGNIGGACFFVPKHVKDRLGFWCERYDLYGEEDADYGFRISKSGFINAYMEDETVMNHLDEPSSEYTEFKKKQRNDNLNGGSWHNSCGAYDTNPNSWKQDTNVLNEIQFTLLSNL